MTGDGGTARLRLVPADGSDPAGRLLADLSPAWHGEVIGPGIDGWETIVEGGRGRPIRLAGLPARLRREIAWMAHWQHRDGLKVSVDVCNQLASMLAWAGESGRPLPSLAWAGKHDLLRLHSVWFHARHGRLPAEYDGRRVRLERLLSYPRLALAARLHDGAWWEMDTWHPRCDPRIPLRVREPCRSVGCSPGEARLPLGEERGQVAPRHAAGIRDADLVHPDRPAEPGLAPLRALAGVPARPGRRGRRRAAGRRLRSCLPALGLRAREPDLGRAPARRGLSREGQPGPVVGRRTDGLPGRPPSGGCRDPRPVALGRAGRRAPRYLAAAAPAATALRAPRRSGPLRR
jgi:hypothetical protein